MQWTLNTFHCQVPAKKIPTFSYAILIHISFYNNLFSQTTHWMITNIGTLNVKYLNPSLNLKVLWNGHNDNLTHPLFKVLNYYTVSINTYNFTSYDNSCLILLFIHGICKPGSKYMVHYIKLQNLRAKNIWLNTPCQMTQQII